MGGSTRVRLSESSEVIKTISSVVWSSVFFIRSTFVVAILYVRCTAEFDLLNSDYNGKILSFLAANKAYYFFMIYVFFVYVMNSCDRIYSGVWKNDILTVGA